MSILNSKSNLQKLRDQSSSALNIFQSTVTKLQEANSLAQTEMEVKQKEIQRLRDEHMELKDIEVKNSSIIDKINEFLDI